MPAYASRAKEPPLPTYEYQCKSCQRAFEAVQAFADAPLTTCDVCGGTLKKVYGAVGIVFKGSGFYKTDSRSSGSAIKRSDGASVKSNGSETTSSSDSHTTTSDSTSDAGSSSTPVKQKDAAGTK